MGLAMMGIYGASKGAAASFTYTWAIELKAHGVRVNALSPMGNTRMGETTAEYFTSHGTPMTRGPQSPPANNAPVVIYLLSDAAKDVTGQIVRIEGKQLSLVAHPGVSLPILDREQGWDVASITEAFRNDLGKRQLPLGVVGLNVKPGDLASEFWKANAKG